LISEKQKDVNIMAKIDNIESELNRELIQVLTGRNSRIDIGERRKVINKIGVQKIIDTDGIFNNLTVDGAPVETDMELEQIIRVFKRPSLLIQQGMFDPSPSSRWNIELMNAMPVLREGIPAIGRIEVKNHDSKDWIGTGFLIEDDMIITNRHVAKEFTHVSTPFSWRTNDDGKRIQGRIDFREEHKQPEEEEFKFSEVVYMGKEDGPDIAILKCPGASNKIQPLKLGNETEPDNVVVTIGYPWKDSRGLAALEDVLKRIFNNIFGVKRLAPGKIIDIKDGIIRHDCTTTGGTSGAPVIDLETGHVVGIHFKGSRKFNSAIPVAIIREILD